ncbi:pseudouridine synthase [Flavobacterium sp.]|jgi:tRNA pseudouridine32 synthase/23S rRNA pseudouridine746 synthase|uniref:pseudouridine synthase n=1 Tax=Flavobacterium sp. TaxID=239 RepID=UPI002A80EE8B|nr:pseudouridine synthase [Flavobacterium sp.]
MSTFFHLFDSNISGISLPEKFTFPFYYEPNQLSIIAAQELQDYLNNQTDFEHNFGLEESQSGLVIGKMFGVLVCQNSKAELGFLAAFSGKLADSNHHKYFVPTVYDMLSNSGFYKKEEAVLNELNREIEHLENKSDYKIVLKNLKKVLNEAKIDLNRQKEAMKAQKTLRAEKRKIFDYNIDELNKESQLEKILFKKMTKYWEYKTEDAEKEVSFFTNEINQKKEIRSLKSAKLQQQLFDNYAFLNQYKKSKSLGEIFENNPPAGAGECAAPKLLHYAFQNNLKPIAMAEFWWGQSPKSEIRKHKQFYPACTGKCEPILRHMLLDIEMDENPFLNNTAENQNIEIVFEDDYLAVIHKPHEFLSVPGKNVTDSVYQRVKNLYPNATGPLIVHRLDMSTSGLMLIAKSEEVYKNLQSQFIKRNVQKRYVALLDGIVTQNEGFIDLPLRVDLDNRPNQLVCYEHGKSARTKFEVISRENNQTRVHFYPITGRTHQLRVHASHNLGLNCPIIGDDLYGTKANRLHLHAEKITFEHPISKEKITFLKKAEF